MNDDRGIRRLNFPVHTKQLLNVMFQHRPLTKGDVARIKRNLEDFHADLNTRIEQIERMPVHSAGQEEVDNSVAYANDVVLKKWSCVVLSALRDRSWSFLYYPVQHTAITHTWPSLKAKYVAAPLNQMSIPSIVTPLTARKYHQR